MGKKIICELLSKSPRLHKMWELNSANEDTLDELIAMGMVEGEYSLELINLKIDQYLLSFDQYDKHTRHINQGEENEKRIN